MTAAALILTITILLALAAMQIFLLAGVAIGRYAWGGKERILLSRLRVGAVRVAVFVLLSAGRADDAEAE